MYNLVKCSRGGLLLTEYEIKIECEQKNLIDILKTIIGNKAKLIAVKNVEIKTLSEFGIVPEDSWVYPAPVYKSKTESE